MSNAPDDYPPWRHIEEAGRLLDMADQRVSQSMIQQTGESKTDILLAALTHAVIALAKIQGRRRDD